MRVRSSTASGVAWVGLAGAVALCALSPAVSAESVPAGLRACAQEPDSLKRLICFDREIARYSDQPAATSDGKRIPPGGSPAREPRVEPATAGAAAPTAGAAEAPKAPKHVAAQIVSIENFPDAIVVHLNNGQVWEQIQEASADANLHAGDAVSIDRELGSFWLSGKSGVAVKVKQKK